MLHSGHTTTGEIGVRLEEPRVIAATVRNEALRALRRQPVAATREPYRRGAGKHSELGSVERTPANSPESPRLGHSLAATRVPALRDLLGVGWYPFPWASVYPKCFWRLPLL